ncbi:hypothetical protein PHMEG_0005488 [Phytophthora megakarya]|uniref:Uncharacterized protein n=1 Tax=Phytophthora megakarya TaxID=4795 RepID=A0A225WT51_9STRA|nr:hypothetical protein PHMEG_0005488 [Phytophthora megakarya]
MRHTPTKQRKTTGLVSQFTLASGERITPMPLVSQRACKLRSVLKRAGEAKLKTAAKNAQAARAFLCNKLKLTSNGEATPCFEVWHRH